MKKLQLIMANFEISKTDLGLLNNNNSIDYNNTAQELFENITKDRRILITKELDYFEEEDLFKASFVEFIEL